MLGPILTLLAFGVLSLYLFIQRAEQNVADFIGPTEARDLDQMKIEDGTEECQGGEAPLSDQALLWSLVNILVLLMSLSCPVVVIRRQGFLGHTVGKDADLKLSAFAIVQEMLMGDTLQTCSIFVAVVFAFSCIAAPFCELGLMIASVQFSRSGSLWSERSADVARLFLLC